MLVHVTAIVLKTKAGREIKAKQDDYLDRWCRVGNGTEPWEYYLEGIVGTWGNTTVSVICKHSLVWWNSHSAGSHRFA